jgi:hypothetical protein
MFTTLSNGCPGIRSAIQVNIQSPAKDELLRVSELPLGTSPPEDSQPILDFIASDESLDHYDEVISASGWRLDTYRRNPVFQNAHQYGDILFTLGKALITEVRGLAAFPSGTPHSALPTPHLYQRIQFATDVNPVARIAYGLYKGRFLNAVSVGFIPLRWLDANGTEHSVSARSASDGTCRAASDLQGQVRGRLVPAPSDFSPRQSAPRVSARSAGFRRKYLEQELLEVSAVGIPANPNALALALKSGAIEKSDLRELLALLKSLCVAPHKNPLDSISSPNRSACGPQPATCDSQLLFLARELHRILRRA